METFRIEKLGHRGDGIAAGPVFAPRTLPGELVAGTRDADRLRDVRILEPVADRIAPPCPHYRGCGGCAVQHARDGFVADWKAELVRTALRSQGLSGDIGSVLTSPPRSRRRATLSARRTKGGALAGFHGRASDTIVAIPSCHLLRPDLMAAVPAAEALARLAGSRKAEMSVQATATAAGLDLVVRGGKPLDAALRIDLARLAEAEGLARLTWEDEVLVQRAPPEVTFGRARVALPPGAFLQATEHGEAALAAHVAETLAGCRRVVDLFAGCGTFALRLAETAEVHAVEGDAAMVQALDRGWRGAPGLKRVTHAARDLFREPLDGDDLKGFDGVVIDPPRQGAAAQVAQLAAARIPVIAHVSCNPATFARDSAALVAAGYAMGPVAVVDQFRWSGHVEMAAAFRMT